MGAGLFPYKPEEKHVDLLAIFIFYSVANGIQSNLAFSKEFKHCNVATFDGSDWVLVDFDHTGLLTRLIKCKDGAELIKRLPIIKEVSATMSVNISQRVKKIWTPWWVRSCNEISRYSTGVDIGFTFNPAHLHSKLLKYNGKRNYQILSQWRRSHGLSRWRQ